MASLTEHMYSSYSSPQCSTAPPACTSWRIPAGFSYANSAFCCFVHNSSTVFQQLKKLIAVESGREDCSNLHDTGTYLQSETVPALKNCCFSRCHALNAWASIFLTKAIHSSRFRSWTPECWYQLPRSTKEGFSFHKSSHSWQSSHSALLENLPLCRTTRMTSLTGMKLPQVLVANNVWETLFLTGSWFPSFTAACKMLTSLTRCSRGCSSLLCTTQSLLHSGCEVAYKEKDLQWSLIEKSGSSAQARIQHVVIQHWKLIKTLIFRETSFGKLSKVNWRHIVP